MLLTYSNNLLNQKFYFLNKTFNCAQEVLNGIEKKGRKFLERSVFNENSLRM